MTMRGIAASALLLCLIVPGRSQEPGKQFKQGEFEFYNEALKDINGGMFPKAIVDLDTWKQKFPESDYKDDRVAYYVLVYAGANQPTKSVDTAAELLAKDLGQATNLRV